MQKTNINWCTHTWNPIVGCSPCSPGCENCYAKALHDKRHAASYTALLPVQYDKPFSQIQFFPDRLRDPLKLKKLATIFVCSMGDIFHPEVMWEWQHEVFTAMYSADWHRYMVLTKRPKEMLRFFRTIEDWETRDWRHLWIGVTVCNQQEADEKIPILLQTPAAHRFVSIEPMLGPIDLTCLQHNLEYELNALNGDHGVIRPLQGRSDARLDLVIVGGETGPNARPMHPDWVRLIRDQCQGAGVPFHFKGWGKWSQTLRGTYERPDRVWAMKPDGTVEPRPSRCTEDEEILIVPIRARTVNRLLDGREHNGATEIQERIEQ